MVEAAQENQVVEAGGAAVHPVADVMRVDEALVRAHGEAAATIAGRECTADRWRNHARLAADVQHFAGIARRQGHERAVAARAAERLRGDAGSVLQVRLARAVWTQRRPIQMNDHLSDWTAGGVAATNLRRGRHRSFSERNQSIETTRNGAIDVARPRLRGDARLWLPSRHAARPERDRSPPGPARRPRDRASPRCVRDPRPYSARGRRADRTRGRPPSPCRGWLRRRSAAESAGTSVRAARPSRPARSPRAALRSSPSRRASAPAPWRTTGVRSPWPRQSPETVRAPARRGPSRAPRPAPARFATPASQRTSARPGVPIPRTHQIAGCRSANDAFRRRPAPPARRFHPPGKAPLRASLRSLRNDTNVQYVPQGKRSKGMARTMSEIGRATGDRICALFSAAEVAEAERMIVELLPDLPLKLGSGGSSRSIDNDDRTATWCFNSYPRARACGSRDHRQLCGLEVNDAKHG